MSLAKKSALACVIALLFCGSVISVRELQRLRPSATLQDVLYMPSPTIVKNLSLGYETFGADIYWTRVVQYFGSRHARAATEYKLLYPLLNIATTLDPKLIPAYDFGSVFLTAKPPEGAGEPQHAIELLNYGIANNPQQWILYRDIGFIYYTEFKNYQAAGKEFEQASKIPGAHPFLKIMAAKTLQEGGNYQTSRMLWDSIFASSNDKLIRDNAAKHIRALDNDEAVTELENLVNAYARKAGHLPATFSEMVAAHYLRGIPIDPIGNPYQLNPDGTVQVEDFIDLPFIQKGLPPGQQPSEFDLSGKPK